MKILSATVETKTTHMKLSLIFLLCLTCTIGFSQTQAEMNQQAFDAYKQADKELNEIYKKILDDYKSDTIFIKNLKASQRIWITFRDAELKVKFPDREPGYYGSIHPLCVESYLEELTRERIRTLKAWIDGAEEDEACNGSVKTKN
jgi:uncharacterized protein YecT (DUF1311 family)